jgi:DNA mismatch repair ATPase MutL
MNLKENINKIFKAIENRSQYERAYQQIRSLSSNDKELFELLWPEAIKSQSLDRNVLLSALTLYHLNIKCPINLKSALLQMYDEWEISIEEVPWYLVNQFSEMEIRNAIAEISEKAELKSKEATTKTILYWLNCKK